MKRKPGKIFSLFSRVSTVHLLCIVVGIFILAVPLSPAYAGDDTKINVMTRNLYLGADIFKVVDAAQEDPDSIPFVVAEVYLTMLYTNFWARAEAIADEIAVKKPDVVGLQEVETFYKQTPGDFLGGNPVQASEVVIDFYEVLNNALEARGMYYNKFLVANANVELPMFDLCSPTLFSDVRMEDHDYILVREDHTASQVLTSNYVAKLEMDLGGVPVAFDRGFVIVDVNIKDEDFRFVSTHLEVRSDEGSVFRVVQYYQMLELLGTINFFQGFPVPKPVIMVGDFNSSPEDEQGQSWVPNPDFDPELPPSPTNPPYILVDYTPPYMLAVGAEYLDTWLEQNKYDEGYTSGFDEYVSDPTAELTTRIDHIFLDPLDLYLNKVSSDVVGDEVRDMVPNPIAPWFLSLWPSDHAGVVAKIKFLAP